MVNYGSCSLFQLFELRTGQLKNNLFTLRITRARTRQVLVLMISMIQISLYPIRIVPLQQTNHIGNVWLVPGIIGSQEAETSITDDYANTIPAGHHYVEGQFLDKDIKCKRNLI